MDFDWSDLDVLLDAGAVIPVVGRELLVVERDGEHVLLDTLLGERLADALGVPMPETPGGSLLNTVAMAYVDGGGRPTRIYTRLFAVMKELESSGALPVPEVLKKLGRMTCFKLYVTTTFDSLLWHAVAEERGEVVQQLKYAMHTHSDDLPTEIHHLSSPIVFHLLGMVNAKNTYVVTEEDMLEVLHTMQEIKEKKLPLLFDALHSHSLLFLGCGYSNWLARFFIRTVRNERMVKDRDDAVEVVADDKTPADEPLTVFLTRHKAEVFDGGAVEFVDAMYARWESRQAAEGRDGGETLATVTAALPASHVDKTVFISYARQDAEQAYRVRDALMDRNISVWLDTSEQGLKPGDEFEAFIRKTIAKCAVIVPLVSKNTEARTEGFFRKEWTWAERRWEGCASGYRVLQPLCVDTGLNPDEADVPEGFRKVNWLMLANGEVPPEFVKSVVETVRYCQEQKAGFIQ